MTRGRLLLIGTPIGNLGDLSRRTTRAFEECDLLLCEDTRVTGKLLKAAGVSAPPLESLHDHNEAEKVDRIVSLLEQGQTIGIASDAGMPLLSDPGFPLVRKATESGVAIEPIPGPFAGALSLTASGLPPVPFTFLGFAPRKSSERRALFDRLRTLNMTAVLYESPHRIVKTLEELGEHSPDAVVAVAREMTKAHEEFVRGTAVDVADELASRDRVRGEITLVIGPLETVVSAAGDQDLIEEFVRLREKGMRLPDAARLLGEKFGMSKREVYDRLREL